MTVNLPKNFKIGIVGSKSVGKTTLANLLVGYLRSEGVDADLVDEVAKRSPLPLNDESSIETSLWILGNQISSEMILANKAVVVCDRTAIDVYPFAKLSYPNRTKELELLKIAIVSYLNLKPYSVVFHVLPQEGFNKSTDIKYQQELDIEFRKILRDLDVQVVEVKSINSNKRLEDVVRWLESYSERVD